MSACLSSSIVCHIRAGSEWLSGLLSDYTLSTQYGSQLRGWNHPWRIPAAYFAPPAPSPPSITYRTHHVHATPRHTTRTTARITQNARLLVKVVACRTQSLNWLHSLLNPSLILRSVRAAPTTTGYTRKGTRTVPGSRKSRYMLPKSNGSDKHLRRPSNSPSVQELREGIVQLLRRLSTSAKRPPFCFRLSSRAERTATGRERLSS